MPEVNNVSTSFPSVPEPPESVLHLCSYQNGPMLPITSTADLGMGLSYFKRQADSPEYQNEQIVEAGNGTHDP